MSAWRFLNTGYRDGPANMSIDRALLEGVGRGTSPPTVRVFGWSPPTVSTGHAQDVSRELDLRACAEAGVGVVRRPTGGRAVLHAGELTYSVVGRTGEPPLGGSIMETYLAIAGAMVAGLAKLGVKGEIERVGSDGGAGRDEASPPCFASAGRFEIVVGGRKLVGSAQRRSGGVALQHGSLLIDGSHVGLVDLLRIASPERRSRVRESLILKTTDLTTILGRPVGFEDAAAAVRRGFEQEWGVELRPGTLLEAEEEASRVLATEYVVCP